MAQTNGGKAISEHVAKLSKKPSRPARKQPAAGLIGAVALPVRELLDVSFHTVVFAGDRPGMKSHKLDVEAFMAA